MSGGNQPHFFLDANQGALAFFKEHDHPDWDNSVRRAVNSGDSLPHPPVPSPSDTGKYLDTSNIRSAIILFAPTASNPNYAFRVRGLLESKKTHSSTGSNIEGFYVLYGGRYNQGFDKNIAISVDVQLFEGLFVEVTQLDSGDLDYEMAPIQYE